MIALMSGCSILHEPKIEGDEVVFHLLHHEGGRAYVCRMTGFDVVVIDSDVPEVTMGGSGAERSEVAQAAREYATGNFDVFDALFAELRHRSDS